MYWSLQKEELAGMKDAKFLIACSGGIDSTVLASMFSTMKTPYGVAYFDHGFGETARSKELALAASRGGPFFASFENLSGTKNKECKARIARWSFFYDVCRTKGYTHVVTGHHMDDLVENILMQSLLRGTPMQQCLMSRFTWIDGICRYKPFISGLPHKGLYKKDILRIAKRRKLQWEEDATNTDQNMERNYVRHALLPFVSKRRNVKKNIVNSVSYMLAETVRRG